MESREEVGRYLLREGLKEVDTSAWLIINALIFVIKVSIIKNLFMSET